MYDVRQFRPALYLLLILGFSGFCLAAQSPGLWVLSVAGVSFNAWLIRRGWFFPLPRIVANLVTLAALLYIVVEVRFSGLAPILVIGQFLVLLQLVKLYEQRANRDYAQLLVLSLLLVVAASINTASLLFGVLLIVYLFLSLYCCLLFHLKVESDHAKGRSRWRRKSSIPRRCGTISDTWRARCAADVFFVAGKPRLLMAAIWSFCFPRAARGESAGALQQRPQNADGIFRQCQLPEHRADQSEQRGRRPRARLAQAHGRRQNGESPSCRNPDDSSARHDAEHLSRRRCLHRRHLAVGTRIQ